MEKKYETSTNWAPWLGIGFLLSLFFFGNIDKIYWLLILLFVGFLPALVVALTLRGYFVVDNNQLKFYYKRRSEKKARFTVSIFDVHEIRQVGKSVFIYYGKNEQFIRRVHNAEAFVREVRQRNPNIKLIQE